jgi:hypothetical protein
MRGGGISRPWLKSDVPIHMRICPNPICPYPFFTRKVNRKPLRYCLNCRNQWDWVVHYIETVRG